MGYAVKYRTIIKTTRQYRQTLYQLARELRRDFSCERVSLYFKDRYQLFVAVLAEGLEGMDLAVKKGEGLVGKCIQARKPLIANDALHHPQALSRLRDHYTGYQTRSLLTAPILNFFGWPVGAVQLVNHLGTGFTEADAARLKEIAGILAPLRWRIARPITNIWTAAAAVELENA
uniref:GAF domain-containing protein n=1 Tax=Desulfobacca acetoxidans TaxID=60893 RepID=A0A7C5AMA8_9BACT